MESGIEDEDVRQGGEETAGGAIAVAGVMDAFFDDLLDFDYSPAHSEKYSPPFTTRRPTATSAIQQSLLAMQHLPSRPLAQ